MVSLSTLPVQVILPRGCTRSLGALLAFRCLVYTLPHHCTRHIYSLQLILVSYQNQDQERQGVNSVCNGVRRGRGNAPTSSCFM
jgi:hypothetical protein